MAYTKPQYPLKNGDNYIYPVTTHDQILLDDGSRWDGDVGVTSVNGETGAANLTYSDVGAAAASHTHTGINSEVASVTVRNEINYPGIDIHGRASGETMNTYKGSIRLDLNTVRNGYPDIQQVNAAGNAAVIVLTMNNLNFSLNGTTLTITKNY